MYKYSIYSSLVIFFIFYGIFLSSCIKEARCDCDADTLKYATIFQPDGIAGKDAVIESITPDDNFGDNPYLGLFAWTNAGLFNSSRILIAFDLSKISPQTQIKSAKLSFYWTTYENLTGHTGDNAFTIYRITQQWDENTVTWINQPLTSETNKIIVPKSKLTDQSYTDIDVTAIVQSFIANPSENYGFILKLNEEFPYKLVILGSCENAEVNRRPKLVVYY